MGRGVRQDTNPDLALLLPSWELSLRRFSTWLVEEDEGPNDDLAGMRPPKLDVKVVDPLSDNELKAFIAACSGPTLMLHPAQTFSSALSLPGALAG